MIYPYRCALGHEWEVIKSVADIDLPEKCPTCDYEGSRYIARTWFYGAKVEDSQFCPALGCVVRSSKHRNQLAKTKGLVEVGNASLESIHKQNEATLNKKLADRWARED